MIVSGTGGRYPSELCSRIGWSLARTLAAFLIPTPVEGSTFQCRTNGQVGSGKGRMAVVGDDGLDAIGENVDLAVDDYLAHNVNYLRGVLGVRLPPLA